MIFFFHSTAYYNIFIDPYTDVLQLLFYDFWVSVLRV